MSFSDQLPILQIVVPLAASPVCLLLRRRAWSWGLALAVGWASFGLSIQLLHRALAEGVIVYALGSWEPPWGIEYRVDAVNAFVILLVALIGAVVLLYTPRSLAAELHDTRGNLFYSAYLLCLTGLMGMAITGDVFNLFVFLEISSLSSYALIALGRDRRALSASFQYLVMGTVGATFFVIGIGLLYMMTGTLNMVDLAQRLQPVMHTRTVLGRLRLPHRRHRPQAGPLPPAPVAAQCLRLCPLGGDRPARGHGHQGVGLRLPAVLLRHLRHRLRVRYPGRGRPARRPGPGGRPGRLPGGPVPEQPQAPAGLFEHRPGRLHDGRRRAGLGHRADGDARAPVQPRRDQGGPVPRRGLHGGAPRRL